MQSLRLDQPREPQTKKAIRFRARPLHELSLVSPKQMLAPVRDNEHKDLQPTFMPARIELS